MIKFIYDNSSITDEAMQKYEEKVAIVHKELHASANDENEFLGWI